MATNKDLLKQYANTGAILPETQVEKLPRNILQSYIRRRILQANTNSQYHLYQYEEKHAPKEYQEKMFQERFKKGRLRMSEFMPLSEEQKGIYIDSGGGLDFRYWNELSDNLKSKFAVRRKFHAGFQTPMFDYLPEEHILSFLDYRAQFTLKLDLYHKLTWDQKKYFLLQQSIKNGYISEIYMWGETTPQELLDEVFEAKINQGYLLSGKEFWKASNDIKIKHLRVLLNSGDDLYQSEVYDLSPQVRKAYYDMGGNPFAIDPFK